MSCYTCGTHQLCTCRSNSGISQRDWITHDYTYLPTRPGVDQTRDALQIEVRTLRYNVMTLKDEVRALTDMVSKLIGVFCP